MAKGGSIIYELMANPEKLNKTMASVGKSFSQVGAETGGGFSNAFIDKMKTTLTIAAVGGAFVKLMKDAIAEGAKLEQSIGGIETLFGTKGAKSVEEYAAAVGKSVDEVSKEFDTLNASQEAMLKNAQEAYRTAGVSANTYMEQVTSFSASLLQGLDGDTTKAAEIANRAMIDMSDNANKFGTDISMIQSAYQGFAKQNYTMLDNLKLG